MRKMGL